MLMDHKKNGYFDQIMPKVKQAIAMGNVHGSVLEIYDQVGRAMFAGQPQNQGEAQAQQPQVQQQQAHQQHQQQQQARQDKQRLEAARKAASMTPKQKQADKPSASNITEEDIFNMSAEELAKVNPKFLLKGK
jgi:transcription initiation factor TFIID subunit TAF12